MTEAAQHGFAAFMLASTYGAQETIHGKRLNIRYSLDERGMEKAMRLYADGMTHDSEAVEGFTSWFNEDVLANPEHDDHAGRDLAHTVLREAIANGDEFQVLNLLNSGVDVNVPDMQGNYLLDGAAKHGHTAIVKLLLARGAHATQCNPHGTTALHVAAFFGRPAVLQALTSALPPGASVDLEDEKGNMPLVAAAATSSPAKKSDRVACVKLLLHKGAHAKKAYNTGAHRSVMALLGAAMGESVSQAAIADAEAYSRAQRAKVRREWQEAFDMAVAAGALTLDEFKVEVEEVLEQIHGEGAAARRATKMSDQMAALKASALGDMIRPGVRVILRGLTAKPELNGAHGRVASYVPTKGRYVVELEADGDGGAKPMLFKVANVRLAKIPEYEQLVKP